MADLSDAPLCDMGGNLTEWVGWLRRLRSLPNDFEEPYALRQGVSGLVGVRCVVSSTYNHKLKHAKPLKNHRPGQTGEEPPAAPN